MDSVYQSKYDMGQTKVSVAMFIVSKGKWKNKNDHVILILSQLRSLAPILISEPKQY